jgi:tripartite-type tricarboxylate transporter receptor subunit TctC
MPVSINRVARKSLVAALGATAVVGLSAGSPAIAAWEPTKPIEFVVPAGTGGGADQMARLIQGIVTKYGLTKQPLVVVNKAGGAGAEGFLDVTQKSKGDPHKIIITLSNLFTTPLATGTPFNWQDMTPVSMMALDQFVLWVNAEKPYKNVKEYIEAAKAAGPGKFKMGGTGSKQEDQIITVGLEKATGAKFTYVPFKGGGEVAVQLVGNHIDSTVNNPIEAVSQWRAGQLRPLCVFDDERMPYKQKITETQSWNDIPTCKEGGVNLDYVMLRGIFMPAGVSPEQLAYFQNLMKKVRETAE